MEVDVHSDFDQLYNFLLQSDTPNLLESPTVTTGEEIKTKPLIESNFDSYFSLPPSFEDFNISSEFETLVQQLEKGKTPISPPVQNLTSNNTLNHREGQDFPSFKSEVSLPTTTQNVFVFDQSKEYEQVNNNIFKMPTSEGISNIPSTELQVTSPTLGTFMGKMVDEKEKRRLKRREQNQRAQQKLRDKRKAHQDELEKQMLVLNSQNKKLDYTVNQLFQENQVLRNQIAQLQVILNQQQAIINGSISNSNLNSSPIPTPSCTTTTCSSSSSNSTISTPTDSDLSSSPSLSDEWFDYYEDDKIKAKELYCSENESSSSSSTGSSPKEHFEMRFPIGIIPFLFVNNWASMLRVLVIMLSVIVIALIVTQRRRGSVLKTIFSFLLSELNLFELLYGATHRVKKNEIIENDKFQVKKHSVFALVWNDKEM